jgi:DnaA regulatory inactivator Hda
MTRQYPLPLPHHEAMEADNLMITASNREAVAWVDRWPAWQAHSLVIHGPAGAGKTHLAHVWQGRAEATLLTAENLAAHDSAALVKASRAIAIDDADQIAGDRAREENLLHLYNMLHEGRGYLLLTAHEAPAQWGIGLPDLRSRLLAAPAIALAAPDDELILALMIKQFRDRQLNVDAGVIEFLLPRVTRSPATIRDLVIALDRASLAENRRITIALARRILEGIDPS